MIEFHSEDGKNCFLVWVFSGNMMLIWRQFSLRKRSLKNLTEKQYIKIYKEYIQLGAEYIH